MLKDYELSKALDIIEKWCLENNFTQRLGRKIPPFKVGYEYHKSF